MVTSCRLVKLIFCITISKFRVRALVSFLLSALADGPVGPSSDFIGVEYVAAREYFFCYLRLYIMFYNLSAFSVSFQIAPLIK